MKSTPFLEALPHLAALIDDERPLISAALLDLRVTEIGDSIVHADVTTQHSYDILTTQSQHDYLNAALTKHWGKPSSLFLTLNLPSEPPLSPLPPVPNDKPKRTANTLTFSKRNQLQSWMTIAENTTYVANESDVLAAGKAIGDLQMDITPGNIKSMRQLLGIEKVKPTPTTPILPEGLTLADLQARLQAHEKRLDALTGTTAGLQGIVPDLRVRADGMQATIADLHRVLSRVIAYLAEPLECFDSTPTKLAPLPN